MKRNPYIRLFVLLLAVSVSLVLFSYVTNRNSQSDNDPRGTCATVLPSRRLNDWRLLFYLPEL